jgi:hypothetical protein
VTEAMGILERSQRLSKKEAAAFLGVEQHTLARWSRGGLCGVVLEQIRVGNRVFFTKEMLAEFQRAVDERRCKTNGSPSAVVILSDGERGRRARAAVERMAGRGVFGRGKKA